MPSSISRKVTRSPAIITSSIRPSRATSPTHRLPCRRPGFTPVAGSPIRLALAAGLALAAPLSGAAATEPEPGYAWMVSEYEGNASLVYGSTETGEDFTFFLSRPNKPTDSNITAYHD